MSSASIERPKSVAAQTLDQSDAPLKEDAPLVEGIGTGPGTGTGSGTANGEVVPFIRPTRPRESIACHDEDGVSSDSDENESAHHLDKLAEVDAHRTA